MASKVLSSSDAFISASELPREELGGGISRQILGYGPDLMIVRVWFEEGAVGEIHSHHHSQSTFVESGKFEVFVDGSKRALGAGDSFYIAPHLDHGAVCLEPGVLIDTFSPAREDFLDEGD
ncbi:cupin domain-containing protein [Altererythrobacter lutimaris]|uniref:Cupin domain-containing protein n=1 Tax=Altererythrobacter lutimaris TaxID=2743979 RepID=A0A850H2T6_9SPHN|nr:cupin domain-containing protein [Altererythrobacter lutimaris]NVE93444.1 cupin domain-containing protein [Altererythrobacter lutimaris]